MPRPTCEECANRINCDECAAQFKHINHAVAVRLDIWKTARAALTNDENNWDDTIAVAPFDVMILAIFLEAGGETAATAFS